MLIDIRSHGVMEPCGVMWGHDGTITETKISGVMSRSDVEKS